MQGRGRELEDSTVQPHKTATRTQGQPPQINPGRKLRGIHLGLTAQALRTSTNLRHEEPPPQESHHRAQGGAQGTKTPPAGCLRRGEQVPGGRRGLRHRCRIVRAVHRRQGRQARARPAGLGVQEAAVATVSGITALQALTDVGLLRVGQSVLIIGASGGVGSSAVQLAAALGATVTGVASASKAALVRSLGAEHVLDYEAEDYLDGSTRYDLILDIGGLSPLRHLRKALTKSGTLVIIGGEGGDRWTGGIGRQIRARLLSPFVPQRLTFFLSAERQDIIERLAAHLERGEVSPAIGRSYPLEEAPTALGDLVAGHARGKSVIVVKEA
ncbi:MAG: NAD(P)-dependent alcohol dehydrogenase [Ornithinimicrobium sp.]